PSSTAVRYPTTGCTDHSTPLSCLVHRRGYPLYDPFPHRPSSDLPDDFAITFTVDSPPDTTPPVRSVGQPMGALPAGTTQTTLALSTNEAAACGNGPSSTPP